MVVAGLEDPFPLLLVLGRKLRLWIGRSSMICMSSAQYLLSSLSPALFFLATIIGLSQVEKDGLGLGFWAGIIQAFLDINTDFLNLKNLSMYVPQC